MGHFERKFQTEGGVAHQPLLVSKKLEWLPFRAVSKYPQCIVTPPPMGKRSIAISLSVCPRAYLWNRWTDLHEILCADPSGRGSVLLWWRCVPLCTSGFMDDVTYRRSGPYGDAWLAALRYWAESDVYECKYYRRQWLSNNEWPLLYLRLLRWWNEINFCCLICVTQRWALQLVIKRQVLPRDAMLAQYMLL